MTLTTTSYLRYMQKLAGLPPHVGDFRHQSPVAKSQIGMTDIRNRQSAVVEPGSFLNRCFDQRFPIADTDYCLSRP